MLARDGSQEAVLVGTKFDRLSSPLNVLLSFQGIEVAKPADPS